MAYKNKRDERIYGKKWYYANRDRRVKQIKDWQMRQAQQIREYKIKLGCSVCGYNKCGKALDFHHLKGDKNFNISLGKGKSFKTLLKEAKKCVVLCKNCHAELHNTEYEDAK